MEADKNKVDVLMATPPPSERENDISDNNKEAALTEANNNNNCNNKNRSCDISYCDFYKLLNELGLLNCGKTCNALNESDKMSTESASGESRRKVKRVVLFGNAFSGKRTLRNDLRLAAMRAETRTRELIHKAMFNNNSNTNSKEKIYSQVKNKTVLALTDQELRESLYNPYADNANVSNSLNQSAIKDETTSNQCVRSEETQYVKNCINANNNNNDNNIDEKEERGKREALCSLARGIGLSQCYIRNYHFSPERELERLSSEQKMEKEQKNQDKYNNETDVKSVVTCDLEFFCCDHASGLHTAVPDADCLEDLLLLIVIDVSQVEGVISTIRTLYKQIEEHVITLLRVKYANEYATHLGKIKEQVQMLRIEFFGYNVAPESNSIDSTTHESIEKLTESVMCPIRSMLVCTHIDSWNDIELNNYRSEEEQENLYEQRKELQNSKELMALQNENTWHKVQDRHKATVTHKIKKLPDAVKSIVEINGVGVVELIKELVCAEGTKHALAVVGISSDLVNDYSVMQESKNNVLNLFLTQMWNAIHCILSTTVNTDTIGMAKSNVIQELQSLKNAEDEQNVWLVFADDNVHATSNNVFDSKINLLSEQERYVMMEYLLGNFNHVPITSINGNSSLNIITHRELINALEAMRTKNNDNYNDGNINNIKNKEIKNDEQNEREINYYKQVDDNSNQHPHNYLPTVSINSTCSIEGNLTNTSADDADEQFVWDTV